MAAPKTGKTAKIPIRPVTIKGIPEREIVLDQVLYWIDLQATAQEIAGSFYISTETLDKALKEHFGCGFLELQKRCDGSAKLSLRRYQFLQAKKNTTMAIWLGKIWLGQRDNMKDEIKELVMDEIRSAVQDLKANAGDTGIGRQELATTSSVLHQRCQRQQGSVQAELGAEDPLAGFTPV